MATSSVSPVALAFVGMSSEFEVTPVPLAGSMFVSSEGHIEVRAPFDGSLIGRVPSCSPADVDRAVVAARRAMETPLPAWKRAEILDNAANR
jgi:acyl-CoA reductase-like NAD-dependent aldehyde dehydrogenase